MADGIVSPAAPATPPAGEKPWWRNETFAGAISESISGVFNYMNMQESFKQQKQMQSDSFNFQRGMTNEMVGRASRMPLLKRVTRKQGV